MIKRLFALNILFLLGATMTFCQKKDTINIQRIISSIENTQKMSIGKNVAPFKARELNGTYFSHKKLRGKITVLNFWFATCIPCIAEFPQLNLLFNEFKNNKKFQMIGMTFESLDVIKEIKDKYKLAYPILSTTIDKSDKLSFNLGYPVIIITNIQGKIIYITSGGSTNTNEIKRKFDLEIIPKIEYALKIN